MIRPLVEQTLEHMSKALADAGKGPSIWMPSSWLVARRARRWWRA